MTKEEMYDLEDKCYECTGYGDDYYTDENGDMVCACDDCYVRMRMEVEDESYY